MDCSPAMESATHIVLRTKEPRSRCCSSSFISNSAARSPTASFTINPRWPRGPIASSKPPSIKLIIPSKTSSNCSKPRDFVEVFLFMNAAVRIYAATHQETHRAAADRRANQLMERLTQSGTWQDYWRADGGTRPFFHPSDAGLPLISLLEYAKIAAPDRQGKVRQAVERSLRFELGTTAEVNNPFGYARQLVRMGDGKIRTAFFFPHDTEAAPWWQGENARLASLAAAARMAMPLFADKPEFQSQLRAYAWNQLHWILGRNPFDTSMLMGSGHGNAAYMFFRSYKYTNAPGAIVNGITAGLESEDGIAFNQGFAATGKDEDWRWTEEWLPHGAWYLYAVSL